MENMKIDVEKIKSKTKFEKTIPISMRIPISLSEWLAEKGYSPKGILLEASRSLGYGNKG